MNLIKTLHPTDHINIEQHLSFCLFRNFELSVVTTLILKMKTSISFFYFHFFIFLIFKSISSPFFNYVLFFLNQFRFLNWIYGLPLHLSNYTYYSSKKVIYICVCVKKIYRLLYIMLAQDYRRYLWGKNIEPLIYHLHKDQGKKRFLDLVPLMLKLITQDL